MIQNIYQNGESQILINLVQSGDNINIIKQISRKKQFFYN